MIILIPIGGVGNRFKEKNYRKPKALINVLGKPLLYYLLDCLNIKNIEYIYIPYNKEYLKYNFERQLESDYPNIKFKFLVLDKNTRGTGETINIALQTLTIPDTPVLCLDSDAFYVNFDIVHSWNGNNCIFTFKDYGNKPIYSYIKSIDGVIVDIKEKEKISNDACSGAYGFSSYKSLLKYSNFMIENDIRDKNEYYTSVIIKESINGDIKFKNFTVDKQHFCTLGVPSDVVNYCDMILWEKIDNCSEYELGIKGHSNFNINIIRINNNYYICKSSENLADSNRLTRQIDKQLLHDKLFDFNIPKIYHKSVIKENKKLFLMEYMYNCIDCLTYIGNNDYFVIDKLFKMVTNVIDKYINFCIYKKIDKEILVNKIESVERNIYNNAILNAEYDIINKSLEYLKKETDMISQLILPMGFCHGDLTLSNILIEQNNGEIYLIDFLDSFIESPIVDIVKIRQDTKFYWILQMCNLKIDVTKIKIIMKYLDNKIKNYYFEKPFYKLSYKYFEILNILRILQYCKNDKIKDYLIQCLKL